MRKPLVSLPSGGRGRGRAPLDGLDGGPHPLVGRRQEPDDGKQQHRGVELVGPEGAGVGAGASAPRLLEHGACTSSRARPNGRVGPGPAGR
jgi:hypothetical protein